LPPSPDSTRATRHKANVLFVDIDIIQRVIIVFQLDLNIFLIVLEGRSLPPPLRFKLFIISLIVSIG
jgi:hypothetical protein